VKKNTDNGQKISDVLPEWLIKSRKRRGYTQQEVVDLLANSGIEISLRTYVGYEAGKTEPALSLALEIFDVLGILIISVFKDDELHVSFRDKEDQPDFPKIDELEKRLRKLEERFSDKDSE